MDHFLPPGPWESKGNRVVTGTGQTIATVFYPRYATQVAEMIARVPEMQKEIDLYRSLWEDAQRKIEALEDIE